MVKRRYNGENAVTGKMKLKIFIAFILAVVFCANAADTHTRVFNPRFRTLKVSVADDFMSLPAIAMESDQKIIISFDEIGDDYSQLQYKLIHCNADWQPSRLVESEYVDGFNIADIEDIGYSENTFVHYVNYRIVFPNPDMRVIHSGNYLLQVFERDNPDDIILQVRMMVYEDIARITGDVSGRTDKGHNLEWQQMEFETDLSGMERVNAFQDLTVKVMQNIDESSERTVAVPLRSEGARFYYAHKPELIYPAGNEYRRFESVSNSFAGMNVDSLRYMGSNYHAWLKPDKGRALRNYEFDRTQHGRYLVREYNATDSDLGADYLTVNFTLQIPQQRGVDIYVDGEMTHGVLDSTNRMVYDFAKGAYTLSMPLKQGAYNYRYLAVSHGEKMDLERSLSLVEGNKYETGNEYSVRIYYHPVGSRGDRLIGFKKL